MNKECLLSVTERPAEAGSEGRAVRTCVHSFPGGLPRQRPLQISVSLFQMDSPPAFERDSNDLYNLFSNDSEEKEGRERGVEEGR